MAGKTTLLRHLLENAAGMKFGCVINDVAGVNVDAKLVRNDKNRAGQAAATTTSDLADTVELSNGCACALNSSPPTITTQHETLNILRNQPERALTWCCESC